MTFATTPPTKPGFYAWRSCKGDDRNFTGSVFTVAEELWASVEGRVALASEFGGEWCRLVPVEEVEKAWFDGFIIGANNEYAGVGWNSSRAKRVMEGDL